MDSKPLSRIGVLFALIVFWVSLGFAQEQSIKKKDIPKGILESFTKSYPKAKTIGYSKETVEGSDFYEIESTEGTLHRDVTYAADGSLISVEETLPFDELPEPVRTTISNEYPGASIVRCEKVIKASTTEFEVLVSFGNQKQELLLREDGTVVRTEVKTDPE